MAKANRTHLAVTEREGQTVGHTVDVALSPVADFAVVEAIIDQNRYLNEVGNAIQRYAVPGSVFGVFRVIERLFAHIDISILRTRSQYLGVQKSGDQT